MRSNIVQAGYSPVGPADRAADRPDLKTVALLALIVAGSGLLGYALLNSGQTWGDDFAAYIMQARSIATGTVGGFMRASLFSAQASSYRFGAVVFPWGFPLLLTPVYAVFGLNLIALKLVLTASYMAFLVAFYLLARARATSLQALLLTALLAFNVGLLNSQNEIMSDLPFLMWSTVALWLMERQSRSRQSSSASIRWGMWIGLVICAAAITRFNGLLLFLPLALEQFRRSRQPVTGAAPRSWRETMIDLGTPYLTFAAAYAVQALLLPNSTGGYGGQFQGLSIQSVWGNVLYYPAVLAEFMQNTFSSRIGGNVVGALLLIFLTIAVVRRGQAELPVLIYGVATLALYIIYPQTQGARYLYPILPVLILLGFEGMRQAATMVAAVTRQAAQISIHAFLCILVFASLGVSLQAASTNIRSGRPAPFGPYSDAGTAMLSFVRNSTPTESVVIFYKPRAMRLFTGRDSFLTLECTDIPKADYIVIVKRGGAYNQIAPAQVESCNPTVLLAKVFENSTYEIFKISAAGTAG